VVVKHSKVFRKYLIDICVSYTFGFRVSIVLQPGIPTEIAYGFKRKVGQKLCHYYTSLNPWAINCRMPYNNTTKTKVRHTSSATSYSETNPWK